MASWAWLDTAYHRNRKVRKAGRDGAWVFTWFICINREKEFNGIVPASYAADLKSIASECQMRVKTVAAAIEKCISASLLVRLPSNDVQLVGFGDDWVPKKRKTTAQVGAVIEGEDASNGNGSPRVEKSREEKSRNMHAADAAPTQLVMPVAQRATRIPSGDHARFIAVFDALYSEKTGGKRPTWDGKAGRHVAEMLRHGYDECVLRAERLFRDPPAWLAKDVPTIGTLRANFDALAVVAKTPSRTYNGRG